MALTPMLCKLEPEIPHGKEWVYEPKWDGFRGIATVRNGKVEISSRSGRPLARYFPEILTPIADAIGPDAVLDGEIIIATSGGLDFESLQMRLHPAASRVNRLAAETPARYVAFDLLREDGKDLAALPLTERRTLLEKKLKTSQMISITPQSADPKVAQRWFSEYEGAGLDGVIAKRIAQPYMPGQRGWVKVKHLRTVDCVVGGYRTDDKGDAIVSLLLGLFDDEGTFHFVGHTSSFSAAEKRKLLKELEPLKGEVYSEGRMPSSPSRWSGGKEHAWTSLQLERVCEVKFDYLQGIRFRHAAGFLRWRDDKAPEDCKFDQIEKPESFDIDEAIFGN